ncbi:hypothetical protein GTY65_34220 [Streptomyces sp. SID8379]|uniref:hypothetical protein n=1 Tax=unclassified Streptomyces TaxID=2593676 RepID=UPI0003789F28|nr:MULTISPECIES: hypothetical protein [unclassified Streptomyces]MYW69092.1 hypothetical protein [Streptomyces sp. SID8379]
MSSDPESTPTPKQEGQLAATIAAHPMLDSVGALTALLAQLPPEMALKLDEHVRADPSERDQVYTVTPRLVGMVSGIGTETAHMTPGLELGTVYVPADGEEDVQAAAAVRRHLPPFDTLARAEDRIDDGNLREGLKDLSAVLQNIALLLEETAPKWLARGDEAAESLRVEAGRIAHAADRVTQLAETVEVPE